MRPGDSRSAAYRSSRRRVRGLRGLLVGAMMGAVLLKDQNRFSLLLAGVVVHLFSPRALSPSTGSPLYCAETWNVQTVYQAQTQRVYIVRGAGGIPSHRKGRFSGEQRRR